MSNYSKQREIILEIFNTLDHPTAEQLYDKVHKNHPTISRSTVYRNLNVLVENKKLKKIKQLDGPDRYDYIDKEHSHIICEHCGRIFDFVYCFEKEKIKEAIQNQTGAITKIDSITVYGICENCKSKIKNKEDF